MDVHNCYKAKLERKARFDKWTQLVLYNLIRAIAVNTHVLARGSEFSWIPPHQPMRLVSVFPNVVPFVANMS